MVAQIEFYEDLGGTKPISTDFGVAVIGKDRLIFMKNAGDTHLKDVVIETAFQHMKGLEISEIAPGEIKPAILWHPPLGTDEQPFEGSITVKAISYKKATDNI
jgi:hypothetical protein